MFRLSRIHFDGGDDTTALIVVSVSELVSCSQSLDTKLIEEILVVVGSGTADKEHGCLAVGFGNDLCSGSIHSFQLFGNDLLNPVFQFLVVEVVGNPSKGLGSALGTDKVDLGPGNSVLLFHHLGNIVDLTGGT